MENYPRTSQILLFMSVSPDGTTLHMDADVLQQLFIIRDRFRDGVEGNVRLYHDNGRMYCVHLYGQYAFQIVNMADGLPYCVYTTLRINPSESKGHGNCPSVLLFPSPY
ncbi:uncharacterized protein MELLADRAFT_103482 [Melampsora larici-populina 98AG31]|uniref:Uncharacterized protein n=1 Tax=Melampsora larici-populina (strain 98AG31 / pathotype 3-4-7) TaxID=747676 RepID=F4RB17_MELLP|nr:uncharacterized protein MELLADRAFT_103482 [Melampsora larici-populina 98AG31]EGG10341.1 hypothetical protein MELLADRAFT_103482 [Melampsora larici-populina 98AG31]